jgi:hypothetical protein
LAYSIEIHFCIHISGLFSDAMRIMNGKDAEGIGHGVIGGIIQEFSWRDCEQQRKNLIQYNWYPVQNPNRLPPKYKSEVLLV